MMTFVALAVLMALAAVAFVLLGARRDRRDFRVSRADLNVAVVRQQLQELARERERGLITASDFVTLRDDLQRRLLADARAADTLDTLHISRRPLIAAAALMPVLAAAIYAAVGSPNAIQGADARPPALLEAHVTSSPGDARAWVLLARQRMDADQFEQACAAYARAIELSRKVANDPQVWAEYADALGMAQGGTLAGKPRAAIDKALALNPAHPKALELAGSAAYEARDFRAAHAHWSALLDLMPQDSPQRLLLSVAVEKTERQARLSLPSSRVN
jgi:cytochrome c-type biogenesis protein CcmH